MQFRVGGWLGGIDRSSGFEARISVLLRFPRSNGGPLRHGGPYAHRVFFKVAQPSFAAAEKHGVCLKWGWWISHRQ